MRGFIVCMALAASVPTQAAAENYYMRVRLPSLSASSQTVPQQPAPEKDPERGQCNPLVRGRSASFTGSQIGTEYLKGPSGRSWTEAEFVSALESFCRSRSLRTACTGTIYVSPGEASQYLARALSGPVDIKDSYSTPPGSEQVYATYAAKCTPAY